MKNALEKLKKLVHNRLIILLTLLILILPTYFLSQKIIFKLDQKMVEQDAASIFTQCEKLSYKEQCYADAFYELTLNKKISFTKQVLSKLQKTDPYNSAGCHFISHRMAQAEVEKDPQNWDVIASELTPYECTGGYIHGVIETHLSGHPELSIDQGTMDKICQRISVDNGYAMRSCYHIMGHIILAETSNDMDESIKSCKQLPDYYHKYECLSGVFMENLTRENLIAHSLAKPIPWDKENTRIIEQLCSKYQGIESQACWKEISYMYISTSHAEPQGLYDQCQKAPTDRSKEECYIYGTGNMVHFSTYSKDKIGELCNPVLSNDKLFRTCQIQAVGSLLAGSVENTKSALALCGSKSNKYPKLCFDYLISTQKRNNVSKAVIQNTCTEIPQEDRPAACN